MRPSFIRSLFRKNLLFSCALLGASGQISHAGVSAGEDQIITAPANQVTLSAAAVAPLNLSQTKYLWEQVEGPVLATIQQKRASSTTVDFSRSGLYSFRVFATDSDQTFSDEIVINVYSAGAGGALPVVDAGSSRLVWMPSASLELKGFAWNIPGSSSATWTKVQGPGTVNFSAPSNINTTATFSAAGIYRLQLSVTAGNGTQVDELVVQVMEASNTLGFTAQERSDYFTHDLDFQYDFEGYRWDRFSRPGPAGEHPRILFGPSDIPDLSNRLSNTEVGKEVKAEIASNASSRLTGNSATYRVAFDDLVAGNMSEFDALPSDQERDQMVAMLTYEAFLALIDNETARGSKVGSALATLSASIEAQLIAARTANGSGRLNYREKFQGIVHRQFIGLAYDFAHNFMTTGERDAVRSMLAEATREIWTIGLDSAPIETANTSNWVPTHIMHCLFNTLAIEGEAGYDADLYPRLLAATERFIRVGIGRDGMTFEGLGKNAIMGESLIAMAKRGDHLMATRTVRNHIQQHYLHTMSPTGAGFTQDGLIGGQKLESRYVDVPAIKYAFSSDPVIDFVYRNDLLSSESEAARQNDDFPRLRDFNIRFPYKSMDFLMRAITAEDVSGATPKDLRDDWGSALSAIAPDLRETYFSNFKGLMLARNEWEPESASLYFKNSTVTGGGHNAGDPNTFLFTSGGIEWTSKSGKEPGSYHSIILVDEKEPVHGESQVIAFDDEPEGAFMIGDASWLYNKNTRDPATSSPNSRHLFPYPLSWMDATLSENINAHWQTSQRFTEPTPSPSFSGIARARRLGGLVRGANPYAVLADDIVSSTGPQSFAWQMVTSLQIGPQIVVNGSEAILKKGVSSERLLVKLVGSDGAASFTVDSFPSANPEYYRLRAVLNSEAPKFRVILYPHQNGDAIPAFSYDQQSDTITVDWGDTVDTIEVESEGDGSLSGVKISRNGSPYYDLEKDFTADPFEVSPTDLKTSGFQGEGVLPKQHLINLKNSGTAAVSWVAADDQAWLSVTPASGVLAPGASLQLTATIANSADHLSVGTHLGNITIAKNDGSFSRRITVTVAVESPGHPTEVFLDTGDSLDLSNTQLTFLPQGDSFVFRSQSISAFPYIHASSDELTGEPDAGNRWDGYWAKTPGWQNPLTISGNTVGTIFVSTNGMTTLGPAGSFDWSPTIEKHFDRFQIALLWTDLDFRSVGKIYYKAIPGDRVIITYENFTATVVNAPPNNNNMQLEIFDDGSGMIRMSYLNMETSRGIVGVSDGSGTPANFATREADFSDPNYQFTDYEFWRVSHRIFDSRDDDWLPEANLETLAAYSLGILEAAPAPAYSSQLVGTQLIVDFVIPEPAGSTRNLEWSRNLNQWFTSGITKTASRFVIDNVTHKTFFYRFVVTP